MADKPETHASDANVRCEVCRAEVPRSAAKSEEGRDYMLHFCGLDCYEHWVERKDRDQGPA